MRTIILQDKATSPNTELRLVVEEEETGTERWREYRAQKLPPRRTQGALTVAEQDPLVDFTWSQDDWSDGALQPYYREGDAKYALTKGADARWKGVVSLGMKQSPRMDFLIRGMEAEGDSDLAVWTTTGSATNPTLTRISSGSYLYDDGGAYTYKYVVATASGQDSWIYQDLTNHALFRGREVKVTMWVKTATLGSSFAPNIYIDDGVAITGGTAITASDQGWTAVTATRTIDNSSTRLRVMIGDDDTATGTTTCTFYFDDIDIQVDGSGDEICAGIETLDNTPYMAQGKVVAQWNEANDVWNCVEMLEDDATDILFYYDKDAPAARIYVATGYNNTVRLSSNGTTWTDAHSSLSGKFLAAGRNAAGNMALWFNPTNTSVRSIEDLTGTSYSSAYVVGSDDRPITGLFSAFDSILVGKEDGLWEYSRVYAGTASADDAFVPISQEWNNSVSPNNFKFGAEWHGAFYTAASSQTFLRWFPGNIQDLTSLFVQPRIPGFGGEIRALIATPHDLWIAADVPESVSAGIFGSSWPLALTSQPRPIKLLSLRQDAQGTFSIHTLDSAIMTNPDQMHVWYDPNADSSYVMIAGRIHKTQPDDTVADHSITRRWALPVRSAAPFIDKESVISKTGYMETSIWHGGVPGTPKAFLKAVFWVGNLGGTQNQKITVKYGLDGEDPDTQILGTLSSTARIQTLYFADATNSSGVAIDPTSKAIGRTMQLQLTFDTDSAAAKEDPPKLFAFEVHSTLRPEKLRTWEVFVRIGQEMMQETGYYDPVSKTKQLSDLDTLEDQVYPIYFKHTYDGHAGFDEESTINVHVVDRERVSLGDEYEIHRLILQEADTSA